MLDDEDNEILKLMFYEEAELVKVLSGDWVKINLGDRKTIVDRNDKIIF
nr:hypothetical protein [uncultured Campylobacter sp.]